MVTASTVLPTTAGLSTSHYYTIVVCATQPRLSVKNTIMARPIRETPVLKGEDAFNFEMRRLEVENRTPEERAEARRKFQERVSEASKHIQWCW